MIRLNECTEDSTQATAAGKLQGKLPTRRGIFREDDKACWNTKTSQFILVLMLISNIVLIEPDINHNLSDIYHE